MINEPAIAANGIISNNLIYIPWKKKDIVQNAVPKQCKVRVLYFPMK